MFTVLVLFGLNVSFVIRCSAFHKSAVSHAGRRAVRLDVVQDDKIWL